MSHSIKNLINDFMVDQQQSWQFFIIKNWRDIVGTLHDKIILEKIERDTAFIGVFDACWMQELQILSATLLAAINSKLEKPYIKQIRLRRAQRRQKEIKNFQEILSSRKSSYNLNARERCSLESIGDLELRSHLAMFRIRCALEVTQ